MRRLYDYDKPESYSPPGSYMDAGRIMKGCVYDFDTNIVQIVKIHLLLTRAHLQEVMQLNFIISITQGFACLKRVKSPVQSPPLPRLIQLLLCHIKMTGQIIPMWLWQAITVTRRGNSYL